MVVSQSLSPPTSLDAGTPKVVCSLRKRDCDRVEVRISIVS